jgi:TolA-binding protein
MALISQEMSATFKMPNGQWAKIVLNIDDIDTNQDIEMQIRESNDGLDQMYGTMKNRLETQVREALDEAEANIRVVS